MNCPICLSDDIRTLTVHSTEPHGERFDEDVLICKACGARFSEDDLPIVPENLEVHSDALAPIRR